MKVRPDTPATRRAVLGGAAVAGAAIISAPYIRNAEAAQTTTWKRPHLLGRRVWELLEVQGIGPGRSRRRPAANSKFKPFAAKEVVGDFELLDGVKKNALEAMNSFTLYWAGKIFPPPRSCRHT